MALPILIFDFFSFFSIWERPYERSSMLAGFCNVLCQRVCIWPRHIGRRITKKFLRLWRGRKSAVWKSRRLVERSWTGWKPLENESRSWESRNFLRTTNTCHGSWYNCLYTWKQANCRFEQWKPCDSTREQVFCTKETKNRSKLWKLNQSYSFADLFIVCVWHSCMKLIL